MESIQPLSVAVQSKVRSGFIISCLTTVVEELIYNSLDAGATKVSVFVAVDNGYVKVEDDGSGISRDGLVLLGERYATSKLGHFHEKDDVAGSFGFRGEALCSIADVSLVEIVTRVHGRSNGYRKVMKGRKCLCLSIDNDRQDVGTTVIVRDLFYNQPVRRRQMQSSAKKVLHSVRKCAVRIALVQPKISFKVIDMESEDELLCTHASPSPLSVLCSNFGVEASSLHELGFSKGSLKLTGYVSAPSTSFSSKTIQYIYVNSRFVVKGRIHKVLNCLADECREQFRGDKGGKRSQPHAIPSYCLNLTCPRSSYDLDLQCSRASVEFKDWAPVLAFIKTSVASLWSKKAKRADSCNYEADQIKKDDMKKIVQEMSSIKKDSWLRTCEISTKKRKTQNVENEQASTKDSLEMQVEDSNNFSLWQNICTQRTNSQRSSVKFREQEIERVSPLNMDYAVAGDVSPSNCVFSVKDNIGNGLWEPDEGFVLLNEDLLENDVATMKRDDNYLDEVRVGYLDAVSKEVQSNWSFEFGQENDRNKATDDHGELLLQCHSWVNTLQTPLNCHKKSRFMIDNLKTKRTFSNSNGSGDADGLGQNFDIFQRPQSQSGVANTSALHELNRRNYVWKELAMNSVKCSNSLPFCRGSFDREYTLESLSEEDRLFSSFSANSDQPTAISYPFLNVKDWYLDHLTEDEGLERRSEVRNCAGYKLFNYEKEEFYHDNLDDRCSNNLSSASWLNSALFSTSGCAGVEKGIWELSHHGCNADDTSSARYGDPFSNETYSQYMGRRQRDSSVCRSPSISATRGVQMNLQRCQAFGQDLIPRERSGRNHYRYSPDSLLSSRSGSIVANGTFSPCLDFKRKFSTYEPSVHCVSSISTGKDPKVDRQRWQALESDHSSSELGSYVRSRSHSAPPFCRGKRKFLPVNNCLTSANENLALQTAPQVCTVSDRAKLENPASPTLSCSEHHQHDGMSMSCAEDSLFCVERKVKETSNITQVSAWSQDDTRETAYFSTGSLKGIQDSEHSRIKWREGCPDTRLADVVNCRHAADERIRLEEMRQKVLSGEMKSVSYLEEEKDLVLPEMAYQLLCNYAEHIKHWGWICNIFSQDSGSFAKNLNLLNERATHLTLLAVPCIMGVNLSDADLLEFLEQLADTDGSSTIPPSVVRVLNYKACRGAIMFGDKLLPSECSLIVEELKRTSLCFQCAHGRPTTVPLLNLKALHHGLTQLRNREGGSENIWHGLCRKEINLGRAKCRLGMARGCA